MGAAIAPMAAGAAGGSMLGPVGAVAGLIGGAISAFGSYMGLESQSANAAYQAQVAANNAKIARQNYNLQIESGEIQVANSEMKLRADLGTTKAGQAASGVDVNSGSDAAVRAGEAEIGTFNALTIRSNNARAAYGYAVEATSDTAESELLTQESEQASAAAPWAAAGSLLSSASTVGSSYGKYLSQTGGPSSGPNPMFGTGSSAGAIF
jgi:hypothetical protein